MKINIVGAGLSGVECALFLANRGIKVNLYEMKKIKKNAAQSSNNFAELVCSNSFRGTTNAVGVLKNELIKLDSSLINVALKTKVPAGNALAVDREKFSSTLTKLVQDNKNINLIEKEFKNINDDDITIIATGPLSSESIINELSKKINVEKFYFYDAIAPIIEASSINYDIVFEASRWQKDDESSDYLNCPMNKEEYYNFIEALKEAKRVELHKFEKYFEGCLPIEVMQERSEEQLRFGPLKPVGIVDPRNPEKKYYAVVQLRAENLEKTYYNLVGFQTKLKYNEQKKVFSKIPGLENVVIERYGSIHRNTFIDSPSIISKDLSIKGFKNLYITGQLSGVEGYVESIAMGLMTAISVYLKLNNKEFNIFPKTTAMGALYHHLFDINKKFQPSNINFSLFDDLNIPRKLKKKEKNKIRMEKSSIFFEEYIKEFKNW